MNALKKIYSISFLYYLGFALTAYLNASFLATIFAEKHIGILFGLGSVVSLCLLEIFPNIIKNLGNRKSVSLLSIVSIFGLLGMIFGKTPVLIGAGFTVFIGTSTVLASNIDLLITHYSTEGTVGNTRGTYLTIINSAWMLAPIAAGQIVASYGFSKLFGLVLTLFVLVAGGLWIGLRRYKESTHTHTSLVKLIKTIHTQKALFWIILINALLQFFYALMIMYTPLYLKDTGGFDTKTIGVILTIMLIPFVLLDRQAGTWADTWQNGEKKLLTGGFICMAIATIVFGLVTSTSVAVYATLLFFTRIGASIVEVAGETYFFKHITEKQVDAISLFRMMNPLAFLVAPLVATVVFNFGGHQILFMSLGFFLFLGVFLTHKLK